MIDRPRRTGARTMLIIDDEASVAQTLGRAAEECGWRPRLTATGEAFRAAYRAEPPAVVIIDLALVGTDGIEILKFLAQEKSESLVLIASGFDRRVVEAAMRFGTEIGLDIGGALTKPVLVEDLKCALAAAGR
ncbi:response regulator [Sphingomonas parva]|nr:response regulator [Sphingomonas parva]